jgi:hypothetical protein
LYPLRRVEDALDAPGGGLRDGAGDLIRDRIDGRTGV